MNTNRTLIDAQCQMDLHWAESCVNVVCPPGFWVWLEENHPRFHEKLTIEFLERINNTWGDPQFKETIRDFLIAISAATAMFALHGKVRR